MKRNWKEWACAAGVRAIKTIAQAGIAGIGAAAAMNQVDWHYVLSASILAGLLSLLTSVAGLPEVSYIDNGGCLEPEDLTDNDFKEVTDDE